MADAVRIVFLGGLGEIGRNCMAVEVAGKIILLDCGLMFPDAHLHGIDSCYPNSRTCSIMTTRWWRAWRRTGTRTTSADSPNPARLTFRSTGRRSRSGWPATGSRRRGELGRTEIIPVADGERRAIGPFDVECPSRFTHSLPHAFAIAFPNPQGVILHSGDLKLDLSHTVDGRLT